MFFITEEEIEVRNTAYDHKIARRQIAEEIVCGRLRNKAMAGDPRARSFVFRHSSPIAQSALLDRWKIDPMTISFDCLGEVIFA